MAARKGSMPGRRKETRRKIEEPKAQKLIKPGKGGDVKRTKEPMKVGRPVTGD